MTDLEKLSFRLCQATADYNYCCSLPYDKTTRIRKVLKKDLKKAEKAFLKFRSKNPTTV